MFIRLPERRDLPAIAGILDDTQLFPGDLLAAQIEPFFTNPNHPDRWFVACTESDQVTGFGFYRPEPLTGGTWNLIAIAVHSRFQRMGSGAQMLSYVEQALHGQRLLIIETSSLNEYDKTRQFYRQCGYRLVATIPEYWGPGDDKIIFSKALQ